jgi:hypothetical protein
MLAERFGRRVYPRRDGHFVITFVDVPVCWKGEVDVPPYLLRHYVRGLIDGDGCLSGATAANGKFYPYVALAYNPLAQPWIGRFFRDYLDTLGLTWREQDTSPRGFSEGCAGGTVRQVRLWSDRARALVKLLYTDAALALPYKRERAEAWGSVNC